MSIPFNSFKEGKYYYVYHFGTVFGENFNNFFKIIKKDERLDYFENNGKTFFIVEKRSKKETPGAFNNPKLIPIKPVFMDELGFETWELAAIKKETLMEFINHFKNVKIFYLQQSKLNDIYFPRLSPNLTQLQRNALELAKNYGFYDFPRKINLDKLAIIMKVSKSTFREHLKRAEKKILGSS
jgi:predicted DNA binding protein